MRVPLVLPHAAIVTPTERYATQGGQFLLLLRPEGRESRSSIIILAPLPGGPAAAAALWPPLLGLVGGSLAVSLLFGSHCVLGNRPMAAEGSILLTWLWQEGKTNLSHDGLNPAHVPCWWVNNPTLPLGCGWEARKSRHRRIKKQRRFERLAATSQLSLW